MIQDQFLVSVRQSRLKPSFPLNSFAFIHPEDDQFWARIYEQPDPASFSVGLNVIAAVLMPACSLILNDTASP
jgi:hypothetical protein